MAGIMMDIATLAPGMQLPAMVKEVRQADINLYADASGDHNPIHIDVEYASGTALGGTIAHGMLVLAYISELMTVAFGQSWLEDGSLDIRFRSPARPGDRVSVSGEVTDVSREDEITVVKCRVDCRNERDEIIINGDAAVRITAA
jgi:3-hydroxybutyryl-CoA dehydratase